MLDERAAGDAILVTGAHGAVGSWLVRELRRRHVPVVGLDLSPLPATPFPELADVPVEVVDIRDDRRLADLVRDHRVERIVHLAAIVVADRDPALAIEVNALATARLLEIGQRLGLRRILCLSTKGVLGDLDARFLHPRYEPVPVDLPPSPRGVYEVTKYVVEVVAASHRNRGADIACVRLASTWGPGKSAASHGAFGLHSEVVAAALRGESSRLAVDPDQAYDLVYHADVAAGLADLVLSPALLGSPIYHLGSGRLTTVADFAAEVEAAFPGVTITTGGPLAAGRSCLMDISAARADAGYEPRWDVARGLADIKELAAAGLVGSPPPV